MKKETKIKTTAKQNTRDSEGNREKENEKFKHALMTIVIHESQGGWVDVIRDDEKWKYEIWSLSLGI